MRVNDRLDTRQVQKKRCYSSACTSQRDREDNRPGGGSSVGKKKSPMEILQIIQHVTVRARSHLVGSRSTVLSKLSLLLVAPELFNFDGPSDL